MQDKEPPRAEGESSEVTPNAGEANRGELRRAAFLKAAETVFLEYGYEASSMAEIVRRAGGSLSTLYLQFGDKEGLFQAVVDERVSVLTQGTGFALNENLPLREGLQQIGEGLLRIVTSQTSVESFRLMVATAKRFPDIANRHTRQIPQRIREALASYIRSRVEAGDLQVTDCSAAAGLFVDMVRTHTQLLALMDSSYRPSDDEIRETVKRAVNMFMGGAAAL